ncbi:putative transmembrane protein [Toxoplasma gondii VAND]|uniref:Putative transmembrane protein n=1 Tax=Toxoplasma gondii VAND TaxID=933077 RepID=A0A086QHW0_TOXGO|nr:putative transmembrane protein [Toxoplasma gondii VAND]
MRVVSESREDTMDSPTHRTEPFLEVTALLATCTSPAVSAGEHPRLRRLFLVSVSRFSFPLIFLFFWLCLSQSPTGSLLGLADGASIFLRSSPQWFSFDASHPFPSLSSPVDLLHSFPLSFKLSPTLIRSPSGCAFSCPCLGGEASLSLPSFSFMSSSFSRLLHCAHPSAKMRQHERLSASGRSFLWGQKLAWGRRLRPLRDTACSESVFSPFPASSPLSFRFPGRSAPRLTRSPLSASASLLASLPQPGTVSEPPEEAPDSLPPQRGDSNSGHSEGRPSSSFSPASAEPRRALSSILLSNLKAKQKRLREAREAEEKERALHAEEEAKKKDRARRRKARDALLINKKKQRKETHRQRVLRSAARRQYLREKQAQLERAFLEDTQTQRSSEKGRLRRGEFASEERRAKKEREIQVLQDLLKSSVLVIQLEAHGLTPNQRWSIVRGLALAGFYKGYRIKHGKNSYMRVALRRIIEERKQIEATHAANSKRTEPLASAETPVANHVSDSPGERGFSSFPSSSPSPPSSPRFPSSSDSGSWRPSARRVRRDFWITHNEELAHKAALYGVDISGNKVKRVLEPEEEETFQALEAEEKSRERRIAERLQENLNKAAWRGDPRFAHLAIGMTRGGVWTQWEDDEELDQEKTEEMPEEVREAGMPYMEVDDWTDLFEEEIRCMREAKKEARAREEEVLNTVPLEGEVTPVAENGDEVMRHLGKSNLYLFVRAMPKNEKRLPLLVKTLASLLEEIVFDNRVKREQKGPPPRKYKGQWYDEELLPHITPEIAAANGFEPPAKDGQTQTSKDAESGQLTRDRVGGEIKVAFLGRSVLTPEQLKDFARRAPTREKLMQKLGGSLVGVTQRLAWSIQVTPTTLAAAVHKATEQKTPSAGEKTEDTT